MIAGRLLAGFLFAAAAWELALLLDAVASLLT